MISIAAGGVVDDPGGPVLPPQRRSRPEQLLMVAVLERAVDDFRTYAAVATGRGNRIFMDVHAWFESAATGPFDFEGVCQAVGLDPGFIRSGIRRWDRPPQARQIGPRPMAPNTDTGMVLPPYRRSA